MTEALQSPDHLMGGLKRRNNFGDDEDMESYGAMRSFGVVKRVEWSPEALLVVVVVVVVPAQLDLSRIVKIYDPSATISSLRMIDKIKCESQKFPMSHRQIAAPSNSFRTKQSNFKSITTANNLVLKLSVK